MADRTTTQIDFHNKAYPAGAAIKFGPEDEGHREALLACGAIVDTKSSKSSEAEDADAKEAAKLTAAEAKDAAKSDTAAKA